MSTNSAIVNCTLEYTSQASILAQNSSDLTKGFPFIRGNLNINIDRNTSSGILKVEGSVHGILFGTGASEEIQLLNVVTNSKTHTFSIDLNKCQVYECLKITLDITTDIGIASSLEGLTLSEITESTKSTRFNAVISVPKYSSSVLLKAFCNFSGTDHVSGTSAYSENVYCSWETSSDGVHWKNYLIPKFEDRAVKAAVSVTQVNVLGETLEKEDNTTYYEARTFYPFAGKSPLDFYDTRPDCIEIIANANDGIPNVLYRFRVLKLREIKKEDNVNLDGVELIEDLQLGSSIYTPIFSNEIDALYSEVHNVSESLSLYYNHRLYGFGNTDFKNIIAVTYAGETVRPLSEAIELNTSDVSTATALVPWKDYVIAFTETSAHVITRDSGGFKATSVNSYIGIPVTDCRCAKNILNGVIFKSGAKLYLLYPNLYSGSETVLNLTDISSPIEDYLIEYDDDSKDLPFALSTETAYMLFMPKENCTVCLKYEYNVKRWSLFEYPVVLTDYEMLSVTDIRVIGYITDSNGKRKYAEYFIEQDLSSCYKNATYDVFSGDWVSESTDGIEIDLKEYERCLNTGILRPINFSIDSGQKTDNPSTEKMFTESKFIVATLHEKDTFPMRVTVHVNGDPKVHATNVYTDSAFWKNSSNVGTLSTSFTSEQSDVFNTIRQMFVRYSGKGKSIRHIIEGDSIYPFKIYEILYRHRTLNTKQ